MIHERMTEELVESRRTVFDGAGISYRCRLYREMEEILPGKDFVVEVWDTVDTPVKDQDLPKGPRIAECEGASNEEVREKVDNVLRQHGYPITGCWNLRGSL